MTADQSRFKKTYSFFRNRPLFLTSGGGGGGGGTPGGNDKEVQFNDSGTFAGDPSFTFDKSTKIVNANVIQVPQISGSLTTLTNGSPYLISGPNITLHTRSEGSVEISGSTQVTPPGGLDTYVQFNEAGSFGGISTFTFDYANEKLFFTGSFSQGESNVASGTNSHAEGLGTIASGYAAHAEGTSTTADGEYSHAEGESTQALWHASHAEGTLTLARSSGSHVEGYQTVADYNSDYSHAEGYESTTTAPYSHAEGYSTFTYASGSHAEGLNSQAAGNYSHAEGQLTYAAGVASHTEGYNTEADGDYSHAEGYSTNALASGSHSEGYFTVARGPYSLVVGSGSITLGTASFAGGVHTIASGTGQFVVGQYNKRGNNTSLFTVGNGTADNNGNRSDVLNVYNTTVQVTGTVISTGGFSGSLTTLTNGAPYLLAGPNITINTASNGSVEITGSAGGGGGGSYVPTNYTGKYEGAVTYSSGDIVTYNTFGANFPATLYQTTGSTMGTSPPSAPWNLYVPPSLPMVNHNGGGAKLPPYPAVVVNRNNAGVSSDLAPDELMYGQWWIINNDSTTTWGMPGGITIPAGSTWVIAYVASGWVVLSSGQASVVSSPFNDGGNKLNTTSSIAFTGGDGASKYATTYGSDVFFYVSGSTGYNRSVFGGDALVSGTLYSSQISMSGDIIPTANTTYNLGSSAFRWANVYTGDLHLRNERGDWTIVEEPDYLCVVNNRTGKRYKMGLIPLEGE